MQTTYTGDELNRVERVAHNRSGLWMATAITVIGLLVFTGIFNFILPGFGDGLTGFPLIGLGLLFSLIPAVIWLYFFRRLDRLEPEPKHMVFRVFLLGALVTAALHDPILNGIFNINSWQSNSWWAHLLGGVLIVGFVEQFIVYATVRYTVFHHSEFDERVDGVIYCVAAALGLATVLNFQYVLRSDGVDLDIGSIRMVINAMAYASFGGILGYFMGQARFEKTPIHYMAMGLTIAAVVNGFFWYILDRSFSGGLNANPWGDLILATIIAIISLGVVFWLIERSNEETLRLAHRTIREGVGVFPPAPMPVPAAASSAEAPAAANPSTPAAAPAAQDSQENV